MLCMVSTYKIEWKGSADDKSREKRKSYQYLHKNSVVWAGNYGKNEG